MIAHLRGCEEALAAFGWTGRRAEWIVLACLHGGVFTRLQWTSFLGCHPEMVRRAVRKLVAQGLAVEEARSHPENWPGVPDQGPPSLPGARSRGVPSAQSDHLPGRAGASAAVTRLCPRASLPAVAADRGRERRRIRGARDRASNPSSEDPPCATGYVRRQFHFDLPLALYTERAVYVDPGHETTQALRSWGAAHRELWWMLQEREFKIEVVAIALNWEGASRADTVLGNPTRDPRPSEYDAGIRREIESIEEVIRSGDTRLVREVCGDPRSGLERFVELQNRARRESGRGLLQRVNTWRSERLGWTWL